MTTNKIMYDYSILRARILNKYDNLDDFALAIKMKPITLRNKLANRSEFRLNEMDRIIAALYTEKESIPCGEITRLFFTIRRDRSMDMMKVVTKLTEDLTDDEFRLLVDIMDLTTGRPDRREYAMNWTGKMKDLPAALLAMN